MFWGLLHSHEGYKKETEKAFLETLTLLSIAGTASPDSETTRNFPTDFQNPFLGGILFPLRTNGKESKSEKKK